MLSATDLPEPDMPLTITRLGATARAAWAGRAVRGAACSRRQLDRSRKWRVPRHEGGRRVDALRAQDVHAHGGFGQHGEVAAGHDGQGDLRHVEVEHAARAAGRR